MTPDLVIFDCDGVLVDSEPLALRVDMVMLADLGWPMGEAEVVRRFMGRSEADVRREIETHLGRPLQEGWDEPYQRRFVELIETELQPVRGVVDALDMLAAAGVPTCVASSGSHAKMRLTLRRTGLSERFTGRIVSATEVARGKPAPDLFLHAAARFGVAPDRCAVVEDSSYGVAAARAAGMRGYGFAGGLTSAESLAGPGTVVFDDMRELPGLLGVGSGSARADVAGERTGTSDR